MQLWALPLLTVYPDKVDWDILSTQSWALPLLRKNLDKVNWQISSHQAWVDSIFNGSEPQIAYVVQSPIDDIRARAYNYMRKAKATLHEELAAAINHPDYVAEHISFRFEAETYEYPRQHLWAHVWSC